jgi:phosphoribosylformimino-5-aminoimidazole carboxamide ribotide isomerase
VWAATIKKLRGTVDVIIIPAIDLKDGCCVRLFKGDFDKVTEYSTDPASVAKTFNDMGFEYLHIVDLDGAREGSQRNQQYVSEIIDATPMSVQLGGGIRNEDDVSKWIHAGVARCVIGSAAITDPTLVETVIDDYGSDRLVLALDIRLEEHGVPVISTHGWTQSSGESLWDCINRYSGIGLRHVLCTDVSRDGAMSGPNIELYEEFTQRFPDINLQASGGVRDIADLARTAAAGAWGTITGRALLDGRISKEEIELFLRSE